MYSFMQLRTYLLQRMCDLTFYSYFFGLSLAQKVFAVENLRLPLSAVAGAAFYFAYSAACWRACSTLNNSNFLVLSLVGQISTSSSTCMIVKSSSSSFSFCYYYCCLISINCSKSSSENLLFFLLFVLYNIYIFDDYLIQSSIFTSYLGFLDFYFSFIPNNSCSAS